MMKRFALSLIFALMALVVASAQFIPMFGPVNPVSVIAYCSAFGYPSAPISTMLKAWYDADSISPCAGSHPTSWADSSGTGNTATFTGGTFTCNSNDLNGHNTLSVSGASAATIATSLGNPQTVFVVYNVTSYASSTSYTLFGGTGGAGLQYRVTANSGATGATQQILRESTSLDMPGTLNVTAATWHQGVFANSPSNSPNTNFLRLDRAIDNSNGATFVGFGNGTNRLFLNAVGNNENFVGKVAALLYYQGVSGSALSATQVTQNECYLYGKYGI